MNRGYEAALVARRARTKDWSGVGLTAGTVLLTLATSYIHSTLGGLLFTLNAIGYATFAVATVVPLRVAERLRWLIRLGLLGFTVTTIVGWILFGARYDVAYIDKAIELILVGLLVVTMYRFDGGPAGVLDRLRALPGEVMDLLSGIR